MKVSIIYCPLDTLGLLQRLRCVSNTARSRLFRVDVLMLRVTSYEVKETQGDEK